MKDFQLLIQKLQKKIELVTASSPHLSIIALSVCILGLVIFLGNKAIALQIPLLQLKQPIVSTFHPAEIPIIGRKYIPEISAQAAYVMDNDSKTVLFSRREDLRFSPASTTKIMTALTALDYYGLTDILTVYRDNVEPVVVGFPKRAQVAFENVLYGMLLPSGNDAAYIVADNYPGGFDNFIHAMNAKAQALHLTRTHFGDPAGLDDTQDYTTVRDLALLASSAIANHEIAQIVKTKATTISDESGRVYSLQNRNKLLGKYGVNGVKTGYTDEAGEVLVTSTTLNNHTFILVVMRSKDRFADTEKLLQMIQDNVTFLPIHP